jgi:hypothetical protein
LNAARLAIDAGMFPLQCLFNSTAQGREEERRTKALFIHDLNPLVPVPVLRTQRLDLHQCPWVHSFRDLSTKEGIETTRHDNGVKRWVGHESIDPAPHQELCLLTVLDRTDASVLVLGVEVPSECVERLVVVVVSIERPGIHWRSPSKRTA